MSYSPSVYIQSDNHKQDIINIENLIIQETNNLYECLQNPASASCSNMNANLQKLQNMITSSEFLTNDEYQTEYNNILTQFQQIITLRQDLDMKLRELYSLNNSAGTIYKTYVDSTVYSNILWTVLATSVVYFIFIKL